MMEEICCFSWNSDRIKVRGGDKEKRNEREKSLSHLLSPSAHPKAEFLVSVSPECARHSLGD